MKAVLGIVTFPVRLILKIIIAILKAILEWLEHIIEKKYPTY